MKVCVFFPKCKAEKNSEDNLVPKCLTHIIFDKNFVKATVFTKEELFSRNIFDKRVFLVFSQKFREINIFTDDMD